MRNIEPVSTSSTSGGLYLGHGLQLDREVDGESPSFSTRLKALASYFEMYHFPPV